MKLLETLTPVEIIKLKPSGPFIDRFDLKELPVRKVVSDAVFGGSTP